jgi:transglutaminase-like putative cysteine protease
MRKILALIIALFFLLIPQSAFAQPNFKTDYNVTYNVLENALTHVAFDITLTNTSSQYYASSYSVQVGFEDIQNILVRDSGGAITPEIKKNEDGNMIVITFNDKIVGLDKKLNFSITFDTADIAKKTGKIWDINIPGLTKQNEYNTFNVKVIVPQFLGNPTYIKPDNGNLMKNNLSFTKEDLGESGISISFGNEQIYTFKLSYHLKNSNLFPIKTEIALPPSTNYQDVQIDSITPNPDNVTRDADRNWLAEYSLGSGEKLDIIVQGKAKVMLTPKKESLSETELKEYLKEQPYWQTSKKEIKDLAAKLKTPFDIYKYVVDHLTYDYARVQNSSPRLGAYQAFKNPSSAVCLEFTDLFIAIARAAGIPAREINGFAFTQNSKERPLSLVKDVLHAWPEYYDYNQQTWIMIDPTWSNTTGGTDYFYTLDYDHFAFIIKGVSSSYPVPAGGYKTPENNKTRDIDVGFEENFTPRAQTLTINTDFTESYFSGTDPQGNVLIWNNGNTLSTPQEVTITTNFLEPLSQKVYFAEIPPFGHVEIPVSFKGPPFLTNKTDAVRIAIGENYIFDEIKITPFVLNKWTISGGLIFVVIIIAISFTIYKFRHIRLSKPKEQDSLRGQGQKP